MKTTIEKILSLFGSHADVAKAAGVKHKTAVSNWKARDSMPHNIRVNLLRNCEQYGVDKSTIYALLTKEYTDILTGESDD